MSRKPSLTVEQINEKRNELSKLNNEQLHKMSRDGLREACTGCLDYKSIDKKDELIAKILLWTEPLRLEKIASYQIIAEQLADTSLDINSIEKIIKNTSPDVAASLIQEMMIRNDYSVKTRVKTLQPRIIKYVIGAKDADYAVKFARELRKYNREDNKQIRTDYQHDVSEYSVNKTIVDYQNVINWATNTLVEKKNWKYVSIALSITSGRRMVEIHSVGTFELGEEPKKLPTMNHVKGWLLFGGQAKERIEMVKDSVGTYNIPCLVDVNLWLEGYQYLVNNKKSGFDSEGNVFTSKEKVNKNYSKELSNTIKITVADFGITQYKFARDFYAAVIREDHVISRYNQDLKALKLSEPALLSTVLGHGKEDLSTQNSYGKLAVKF